MERNKIIQHKEKPCIKASVVMLPTDKETRIVRNLYLEQAKQDHKLAIEFAKEGWNNEDLKDCGYKPQHLYITSDEPIKEGEYGYDSVINKVFLVKSIIGLPNKVHPVIATTDKSLKLGHDDTVPYPKRKSLPQPSQAFISAFVKANGVGFEETLVEVKITGRCKDPMVCLRGCDIYNGTCKHIENMEIKLLIDQNHNTITIHPVKPKVYSREDVMLHLYNLAGNIAFKNSITIDGNYITYWIKRNLK